MIVEKIEVGKLATNCYLAGSPEALIVIDPGDEAERILAYVSEKGYKVKYVVLTHCHYDHIGAAAAILNATGAKLILGEKEKENYQNRRVSLCGYFSATPELKEPDRLVCEGDTITSGEYTFTVLETPGHTSGSMSLLCEDKLFSGDTLFYLSVGRADFPTGDMDVLVSSIREKLFTLPDSATVYPGHGEVTNIGFEKLHNPFLK